LIRLDHDLVGAVDALDPRRTISERRIDAGLPQIGRFEHVRVRRENEGQHRHLLSDLITSSTFGNRPIAVKVSAVSDPCQAAVKVGSGSTRAEPVVMRTAGIGATSPSARVSGKDRKPPNPVACLVQAIGPIR
jgi:hypothetical protein